MPNLRHILTSNGHVVCICTPLTSYENSSFLCNHALLTAEVLVYGKPDDDLLYRSSLATGDMITSACWLPGEQAIAIGVKVHAVGQLRILRFPHQNGGVGSSGIAPRRRFSNPQASPPPIYSGGKVPAPSQLVFASDIGFPQGVNAIASIGEQLLLVATASELHFVMAAAPYDTIKLIRSDTWRSPIIALSCNGNDLLGVATHLGGLALHRILLTNDNNDQEGHGIRLVRCWSTAIPDLIDRLVWCRPNILAASDRRGFVHFVTIVNKEGTMEVKRAIKGLTNGDIPIAISPRFDVEGCAISVLVSGVSGTIHELPLPE
jgi:hypothetical protein